MRMLLLGRFLLSSKSTMGLKFLKQVLKPLQRSTPAKSGENECLQTEIPNRSGVDQIVAELDGSMIPIVSTDNIPSGDMPIDRRKTRKVCWKEARLALARPSGSVETVYETTLLGDVDDAGDRMAHCAVEAGAGENTRIHCVSDGAPWIADQTERVFGLQGSFTVDFYHLCDYLGAAAGTISPDNKKGWLADQKKKLKEGEISDVIGAMEPHVEPDCVPKEQAPVRTCYNYMRNRRGQFCYKEALDEDLPIGSGAVESAHRYVIQDRLKIAGAWWTPENAHNMLALRDFTREQSLGILLGKHELKALFEANSFDYTLLFLDICVLL